MIGKDFFMESKYEFGTNDELKGEFISLTPLDPDEKSENPSAFVGQVEEDRVYTLNGIDLKRVIDGKDLGKLRLVPGQQIAFAVNDDWVYVVESDKIVLSGYDRRVFIPESYLMPREEFYGEME